MLCTELTFIVALKILITAKSAGVDSNKMSEHEIMPPSSRIIKSDDGLYNKEILELLENRHRVTARKWEARMEAHKLFMRADARLPESDIRDRLVGHYIVECETISEQWPDTEDLSLRIVRIGPSRCLVGFFEFGVIEGIMHIGLENELLPHKALIERHRRQDGAEDGSESDEQIEEHAAADLASMESGLALVRSAASAKGLGANEQSSAVGASKRKAPGALPREQVSKKSRKTTQTSRKLHFLWRGRETGEGEIQLDDDNSNTGQLEFVDDGCAVFNGWINGDLLGYAGFKGYKTSLDEGEVSDSWDAYSGDAYESARVNRWH